MTKTPNLPPYSPNPQNAKNSSNTRSTKDDTTTHKAKTASLIPKTTHTTLRADTVREKLARAYVIFAKLGMDDQTYTHLSARLPGKDSYVIYPLGMLFEEVTPDNLIEVDFEGNILSGHETIFNATGYVIHSSLYKARPDLNAIFHLHTHASCAVAAMTYGLLPISQFAYHFFERLSYYNYDALSLDADQQGHDLATSLGGNNHMLLRNHGALTSGSTIEEAFFYMMFLENACKVQVQALSAGLDNLIIPDATILRQAQIDMTNFEHGEIGVRDFEAHSRVTPFSWEKAEKDATAKYPLHPRHNAKIKLTP